MKKFSLIALISFVFLSSGCLNLEIGPTGEIQFKAKLPEQE